MSEGFDDIEMRNRNLREAEEEDREDRENEEGETSFGEMIIIEV